MMPTRRLFLGTMLATMSLHRAAFAQEKTLLRATREMRSLSHGGPARSLFLFDSKLPGPTLRLRLGEQLTCRLQNELDAPLTLHWRGVRLANAMDGVAGLTQAAVDQHGAFDIAFTPPDAGTFLYHPGARAHAAQQMAGGLSGLLIVEEREPPPVDADLAVLLSDWTNAAETPFALANGLQEVPVRDFAPGSRIRLRLASASTRRVMAVGLEGVRAQVAAIDGQPCGMFEPVRQTVPLVPGGRYDIFFDLPPRVGEAVMLVLRGMSGAPESAQVLLRLRTDGPPRAALPAFSGLPDNPRLPARIQLERARRIDFVIEGAPGGPWRLNGQAADVPGPKPLASVRRGTPITLSLVNRSTAAQLIHVHGHALRHMHLMDDGWEPYWRDSVIVPEGKTVRTAFVADNPGRWLIAGGFGSDEGPAGWFEVT